MTRTDAQPDFTVNSGGLVAIAHSIWESSKVRVRSVGRVGWWMEPSGVTIEAEDRTWLSFSGGHTMGSVWIADWGRFIMTDQDTIRGLVEVADNCRLIIITSGAEDWELDGVAIGAYEDTDLGATRDQEHTLSGTNSVTAATMTVRFVQRGPDSMVYVLSV